MSLDKTYPIPNLTVPVSSVDEDLQGFIQDILYQMLYRKQSAVNTIFKQNGSIDATTITSLLSSEFTKAVANVSPSYSKIKSASFRITDAYSLNAALNVFWEIQVESTGGTLIAVKSSAKFPD